VKIGLEKDTLYFGAWTSFNVFFPNLLPIWVKLCK